VGSIRYKLTAHYSNAVNLISSVLLLKTNQLDVLRATLVGTILQNILLMPGLAFFVGGLRRQNQNFNVMVAQAISIHLLLAVTSVAIPTISQLTANVSTAGILAMSRGTAVVTMSSYASLLIFSLFTHVDIYEAPSERVPKNAELYIPKDALRAIARVGAYSAASAGGSVNQQRIVPFEDTNDNEEEVETYEMLTLPWAIIVAVGFTTILAFNTQFATDSIQGLMAQHGLSSTFMGMVILPILSNDVSVVKCATADNMDSALALTFERAIQTALMVIPLVILIAWGMQIEEMSLALNGFTVRTTT
jgi:Ca2+:H+ antiporter